MGSKQWLFGKTLAEIEEITLSLGMPRFTARQVASWLYPKPVYDISEMTNLSLRNRDLLAASCQVGGAAHIDVSESTDGTKKYLFPTLGGRYIESAYIPDRDRATLCVSSQSGCRMACRFCMTARQGFGHDLTTGEILNQVVSIPEAERLTNIVYMGMGEPLDNTDNVMRSLDILTSEWGFGWSPTRITLSTIGVLPGLKRFLDGSRVNLAVSLHDPIPQERRELMPFEGKYPIEKTVELLRRYDFTGQRRVSFEYIMFRGVNDSPAHLRALVKLLAGLKCRVNLIRFHRIPDSPLESTSEADMVRFRDALTAKGIMTTIRASRGEDIMAACGLLSTKRLEE